MDAAVVEGDTGTNPFRQRLSALPPPPKVEALAKRAGFVLVGQRLEEVSL